MSEETDKQLDEAFKADIAKIEQAYKKRLVAVVDYNPLKGLFPRMVIVPLEEEKK